MLGSAVDDRHRGFKRTTVVADKSKIANTVSIHIAHLIGGSTQGCTIDNIICSTDDIDKPSHFYRT